LVLLRETLSILWFGASTAKRESPIVFSLDPQQSTPAAISSIVSRRVVLWGKLLLGQRRRQARNASPPGAKAAASFRCAKTVGRILASVAGTELFIYCNKHRSSMSIAYPARYGACRRLGDAINCIFRHNELDSHGEVVC